MPNKLKLYLVSMLGVRPAVTDDGEPQSLFCHIPFMIEATDIDAAADEACNEAEKWFPRSRGFVTNAASRTARTVAPGVSTVGHST